MATKKCPVCGVSVKVENLERHMRNQHPHAEVDTGALLTKEEKEEVEEAKASARPTLSQAGKRTVVIVAVVLVVILVVAVLASTWRGSGPHIGDKAPEFSLTSSTGTTVTLSGLRGRPVFIEFMNTRCPACISEAPTLSSVYKAYTGRVVFVSIDMYLSPSEPLSTNAEIEAFKTQYDTPWDYVIDSSGNTVRAYVVTGTPTMFVVDANGIISATPAYPAHYSVLADAFNKTLG